jgi:hypothetical protein
MKKIRRLITLILGLDGLKVTRQVEDIQWGLRLQSLCMGSKWFRGGCLPWRLGSRFSFFMCIV